jgi:hypothetical protein
LDAKNDYIMARFAAQSGLFLDTVGTSQDSESMLKWAQEEKKLHSERGLICLTQQEDPLVPV